MMWPMKELDYLRDEMSMIEGSCLFVTIIQCINDAMLLLCDVTSILLSVTSVQQYASMS